MLDLKRVLASAPPKPEDVALRSLFTVWGEETAARAERASGQTADNTGGDSAGRGGSNSRDQHPHPQFQRESFTSLDGWWNYRIESAGHVQDADCATNEPHAQDVYRRAPLPAEYEGRILVPFSPEAPLSGVNRQLKPNELLWYRRTFLTPVGLHQKTPDEAVGNVEDRRCILHFEAVDHVCICYVNGQRIGEHVGGYLPFSFDITDALVADSNELVVCVSDPSDMGTQLRGKQKLARGGIWYTAQSGIWQTVWLEVVPRCHIESLSMDVFADEGRLVLTATVCAGNDAVCFTHKQLVVRLLDGTTEVARAVSNIASDKGDVDARCVQHPGVARDEDSSVDDLDTRELTLMVEHPRQWSPDDPYLYRLELVFGSDRVKSYCAFRTVSIERDEHGAARLCLNHEPVFLRGILDQGYWPDGLMTAPADEALVFDIETMKRLGFNMLRKHIKVESDRWYYHCDRLGMLVWQDMVCGGSPLSAWHTSYKPTFFRHSWGRYADDNPRHRGNLSAGSEAFREEWRVACRGTITHLGNHPSIITWVLFNEGWGQFDACSAVKTVRMHDPSRAIDAVSGWYDQRCGDFLSVHNYFRPLAVYGDSVRPSRAFVISEFGGLSYLVPDHSSLDSSYGYGEFSDAVSFGAAVRDIIGRADALEREGLAGFVYTQLSDVEEEVNGLLTYDRRVNKLEGGGTS